MQGGHHKRIRGASPRRACDPAVLRCFGETRCVAVVHGAPGGCETGVREARLDELADTRRRGRTIARM
ncbi:hypothetical protein CFB46_17430 [Burkholderia sp. HI2761]|nr:hypothetical protein CFB46_17430 [Burkholderia sp. HI2761]